MIDWLQRVRRRSDPRQQWFLGLPRRAILEPDLSKATLARWLSPVSRQSDSLPPTAERPQRFNGAVSGAECRQGGQDAGRGARAWQRAREGQREGLPRGSRGSSQDGGKRRSSARRSHEVTMRRWVLSDNCGPASRRQPDRLRGRDVCSAESAPCCRLAARHGRLLASPCWRRKWLPWAKGLYGHGCVVVSEIASSY